MGDPTNDTAEVLRVIQEASDEYEAYECYRETVDLAAAAQKVSMAHDGLVIDTHRHPVGLVVHHS